ncbi:MAG: transglycosylase domain-containing protein [candidate division WOR-3 bacterium]
MRLSYGLPKPSELQDYRPITSTKLFDIRGEVIADFAEQRREPVSLSEIPDWIKQGIIAVEDKRFYRHWGIDIVRLFGVAFYNLKHLRVVQGGSTITQQLARNMFLTMAQTLELYLNQVNFGSGAYGVEAAAQTFFGRPVRDLTLVQCATISALPASPGVYSPYEHADRCMRRRNLFLRKLAEIGRITRNELVQALAEPVRVSPRKPRQNQAPYFVEEIRQYLEATY